HAVVTLADRADDSHARVDLTLVYEEPGHRIFASGPCLVGIREGVARPAPARPRALEDRSLLVHGVGALAALVVDQRLPEVVPEDRAGRHAHVVGGQEVTEPHHVGEPLAEELVGEASRAVLVAGRGLALADSRRVPLRVLPLRYLVGFRH